MSDTKYTDPLTYSVPMTDMVLEALYTKLDADIRAYLAEDCPSLDAPEKGPWL